MGGKKWVWINSNTCIPKSKCIPVFLPARGVELLSTKIWLNITAGIRRFLQGKDLEGTRYREILAQSKIRESRVELNIEIKAP